MENQLKDYLHLYIGCDCYIQDKDGQIFGKEVLTPSLYASVMRGTYKTCFPHLRHLSDFKDEEYVELSQFFPTDEEIDNNVEPKLIGATGELARQLLLKHIDLFNLIEAGLAIDKKTIKTQQ